MHLSTTFTNILYCTNFKMFKIKTQNSCLQRSSKKCVNEKKLKTYHCKNYYNAEY